MAYEMKSDLRVVKTRAAIKGAIKQMICEMPLSEITVKELTERAMIHRKTVDFSKQVYLSIRCLDGTSVWTDMDTSIEEYYANYSPVYLADFGTVTLEAFDTAFISALPWTKVSTAAI